MGIKCPIIREGDDLLHIVTDAVLDTVRTESGDYDIQDNSVIGITESVVARSQGNYATIDDIANDVISKFGNDQTVFVLNPIYSRNRFAIILKGIARAAKKIVLVMPDFDEVGNVRNEHPFTKVNYDEYYKGLCEQENAEAVIYDDFEDALNKENVGPDDRCNVIIGDLHEYELVKESASMFENVHLYSLADICSDKCEYGVLGSNKADENRIKLFPKKEETQKLVNDIKAVLEEMTGKHIVVTVYGDGCFKDPVGGIWEFADPVSMPAYTDADIIESTPNEVKVKALADDKFKDLHGDALNDAIKNEILNKKADLKGDMQSQGTTPRLYRDLLASLMDLTSGSGDRCTPIILIQNYL